MTENSKLGQYQGLMKFPAGRVRWHTWQRVRSMRIHGRIADRELMSSHLDSTRAEFRSQAEAELALLRELCDETAPRNRRLALIEAYAHHAFVEPEHQVLFESISVLLSRGSISSARLQAHLTNRGFPDIDVGRYIPLAEKM